MSEHHHSHHRHHHHKQHRGVRSWLKKNQKLAILSVCVGLVVCILGGIFIYQNSQKQKKMHVTGNNSVDVGSGYRDITYKGKKYRYNNLITSVLFAGIDSEGEMKVNQQYSVAPRSDSIYLVVMNQKTEKMTIIGINRDTMTQVRRYTISGYDRGTYETHIGFAYTYGDGGEASCENLREAVSALFHDLPITEYAVINRSSMTTFNHLVDGVEVTVPNDELSELHPEWIEGAVVKIQDEDVESYLRYRDTGMDFSNEGRMARQKSYIIPYIEKLRDLMKKDTNKIWSQIEESEKYIQTSITKNKYVSMANLLDKMDFNESDFYILEGEDQLGEGHDEFYVDQEALLDKVVELFYEEI